MSITSTPYNFGILSNYISDKEFLFLSENSDFNTLLNKENKIKVSLLNFIQNVSASSSPNLEFVKLLPNCQNALNRIHTNETMILQIQSYYKQFLNKVASVLTKIELNPGENNNYENDIFELKKEIANFSEELKLQKDTILSYDSELDSLLSNPTIVKFFSEASEKATDCPNNSIDIEDNNILLISEKSNKVFLPYTVNEITSFLEQYPEEYSSPQDVIKNEFIFPLNYYSKTPTIARFREAYSLIKDREFKGFVDAFKFAIDTMFKSEINPAIIAACKTQEQLEKYMACLKRNQPDAFDDFIIKYEFSPAKIYHKLT